MTGFEWEGTGGFRTPDHILIEMSGGGDGTEEGAVRVDGEWERMERGEEEEKEHIDRGTKKQESEEQGSETRTCTRRGRTQTGV